MEEIAEELDVETLVISIAAGVSLSRLQEYLNTGNLIRVMPNTPAQIGSGVSGWIADRSVSEEDKAYVRSFLAQVGIEVEVRNEDQIDQIGQISVPRLRPCSFSSRVLFRSFWFCRRSLSSSSHPTNELVLDTHLG